MGVMEIGDDNSSPQQQRLMILNAQLGLKYKMGKDVADIHEGEIVLRDMKTKQEETLPCDSVLICRGYTGRPKIYTEICEKHKEVYLIGDSKMKIRCNDKRNIGDAILEGWQVGNRI